MNDQTEDTLQVDELFNKWFDEHYPKEQFGELNGIFRRAIYEVAFKAFQFGIKEVNKTIQHNIAIVSQYKVS